MKVRPPEGVRYTGPKTTNRSRAPRMISHPPLMTRTHRTPAVFVPRATFGGRFAVSDRKYAASFAVVG